MSNIKKDCKRTNKYNIKLDCKSTNMSNIKNDFKSTNTSNIKIDCIVRVQICLNIKLSNKSVYVHSNVCAV